VELYRCQGEPLLRNLKGDARYRTFLKKLRLPA